MIKINAIIREDTKQLFVKVQELIKLTMVQHDAAKKMVKEVNEKFANKIFDLDKIVSYKYSQLKSDIEFTITKRPLGKELRRVIAYLMISTEIKKMSGYAKNIANFILEHKSKIAKTSLARILKVHKPFRHFFANIPNILEEESADKAFNSTKKLEEINNVVDEIQKKIIISVSAKKSQSEIEQRIFVLKIVNSLDRAANHLFNICENVVYISTGNYGMLKK